MNIRYGEIPHFCPTHANGHAGQLVTGYLSGVPVVLLQGRAHRYEGLANHQAAFPTECLHADFAQIAHHHKRGRWTEHAIHCG